MNLLEKMKRTQTKRINKNEKLLESKFDNLVESLKQVLYYRKEVSKVIKQKLKSDEEVFIKFLATNVYRTSKTNADKALFVILDGNHNETIKESVDRKSLMVDLTKLFPEMILNLNESSIGKILDAITAKNYVKERKIIYDYHSKENFCFSKKIIGDDLTIELKMNTLNIDLPEKFEIERIEQNLNDKGIENPDETIAMVIKEFTEVHNPYYNDLYRLIVGKQFASVIRNYMIYLLATAGGAKSFQIGIRTDLGINTIVKPNDLFANPSSYTIDDLEGKLVIDVDDSYAKWHNDFRNCMNYLQYTPKYQSMVTLNSRMIILSCKNPIKELENNVDTQNSDRVNKFKLDTIPLEERKMFKKVGRSTYFNIIGAYTYLFIIEEFEKYISMKKIEATETADKLFEDIYSKYGLGNVATDLKVELQKYFLESCEDIANEDEPNNILGLREHIKRDPIDNHIIYIKSVNSLYKKLCLRHEDDDFSNKAMEYYPNIDNLFSTGIKEDDNAEINTKYKLREDYAKKMFKTKEGKRIVVSKLNLKRTYANNPDLNKEEDIELVIEEDGKVISSEVISQEDLLNTILPNRVQLSKDEIEEIKIANPYLTTELIELMSQDEIDKLEKIPF